jgi:nucleotide-binding universal stress UspA family protein
MLRSILCAIDGSAYTQTVIDHGLRLAQRFEANLRFISIVDVRMFEWVSAIALDGFVPAIPGPNYLKESRSVLEKKANETLMKAVEQADREKLNASSELRHGVPAEIICENAKTVDLVVMGRRGEFAQWSGQMVGATLEAVSHSISRPLLVTDTRFCPFAHAICAYDGSDCSARALRTAMDMASRLQLAVTVLSVGSDTTTASNLKAAEAYCQPYAVNVDYLARSGQFVASLEALLKEKDDAFVIMGSHGTSRIRQAILGSTTLEALRKVAAPIIIQR